MHARVSRGPAVALAKAPASRMDPTTLPDGWLDIDVDSEKDGFVVRIESSDFAQAKAALARAERFNASACGCSTSYMPLPVAMTRSGVDPLKRPHIGHADAVAEPHDLRFGDQELEVGRRR